jgi:hypothetical protein
MQELANADEKKWAVNRRLNGDTQKGVIKRTYI